MLDDGVTALWGGHLWIRVLERNGVHEREQPAANGNYEPEILFFPDPRNRHAQDAVACVKCQVSHLKRFC